MFYYIDMDEVVFHISKAKLIATVGLSYPEILKDLIETGLVLSHEETIAIRFKKDKAIHVQSALEFYDTRNVPSSPNRKTKTNNNEED